MQELEWFFLKRDIFSHILYKTANFSRICPPQEQKLKAGLGNWSLPMFPLHSPYFPPTQLRFNLDLTPVKVDVFPVIM